MPVRSAGAGRMPGAAKEVRGADLAPDSIFTAGRTYSFVQTKLGFFFCKLHNASFILLTSTH